MVTYVLCLLDRRSVSKQCRKPDVPPPNCIWSYLTLIKVKVLSKKEGKFCKGKYVLEMAVNLPVHDWSLPLRYFLQTNLPRPVYYHQNSLQPELKKTLFKEQMPRMWVHAYTNKSSSASLTEHNFLPLLVFKAKGAAADKRCEELGKVGTRRRLQGGCNN